MPDPVLIPLLNPNEPEAVIVGLHIQDRQLVSTGDLLCTLETTKSTLDLHAESNGYVSGLRFTIGQSARAGELLCYLAETPDWKPPDTNVQPGDGQAGLPVGLRITRPALVLARSRSLDLSRLPVGPLVTEKMVNEALARLPAETSLSMPVSAFDPTAIIVYGGGGHGKSLIDLLRSGGVYHIVGLIDDGIEPGGSIMGVPVLGGKEALPALYAQGVRLAVNAVGGIGDVSVRITIFHRLAEAGFTCPAVSHPTSFIEMSAFLSPGVQVFPHAYVGSEAKVGFGCIVNTGAIVSHDCRIGDFVNISPGAILAGDVHVERGCLIGMGVTVNLGVNIGSASRVGNGATVKSDVPSGTIVRAGTIWPT